MNIQCGCILLLKHLVPRKSSSGRYSLCFFSQKPTLLAQELPVPQSDHTSENYLQQNPMVSIA